MLAVIGCSSPNSTSKKPLFGRGAHSLTAQFAVIALANNQIRTDSRSLLRSNAFGGHPGHRLVLQANLDRPMAWTGSALANSTGLLLGLKLLAASRRASASALALARIASFLASRAFSAAASLAFAFSFSASFLAAALSASLNSSCFGGLLLGLVGLRDLLLQLERLFGIGLRLGLRRLCNRIPWLCRRGN